MILVSEVPAEFRIKRLYTSNNGKISYFYTFEEDKTGSFELWSNKDLNLEKGKLYNLSFNLHFFNGERRVDLVEVIPYGK